MQDSENCKHIAHYNAAHERRRYAVLQEHTGSSCRVSYYEKPECRQDIELKIQLEIKDVKSMSLIFRSPNFAVGNDAPYVCMKTRGEMYSLTVECMKAKSKR
ncbi:hypothetical protein [uncultured Succinatimonas sp.]|uniref:hypothetical protein n=1 Tax=uncultured Succinatimonas sp. TaxID=1262973 RepID=UPI0025F78C1B|nr:hypothetical protein [uncultured Succinatimonas sp.]